MRVQFVGMGQLVFVYLLVLVNLIAIDKQNISKVKVI